MDPWKKFLSKDNFNLAWRRINTGYNIYYKRFFRDIYLSYEISLDANLENLIKRIKGGSYKPQSPDKIFIPKKSGLQRPITLLTIEDQIIWQAFANILEIKWKEKRKLLENNVVFSSISNPNKIFFFEHWKSSYQRFLKNIKKIYKDDNQWAAHFDLAAYFDTISHNHISKLITPRDASSDIAYFILQVLRSWTAETVSQTYLHGIPQGPIASSYIGELVFLDIDISMLKARDKFYYLRYVDDIRIFAKDEDRVRDGIVNLEQFCRNKGLIPQSQKTCVFYAQCEEDAVGKDFSIAPDDQQDILLEKSFLESVDSKKNEVINMSKFTYFLFRGPAFPKHLDLVLNLFEKYPHISDAFVAYLSRFENDNKLIDFLVNMIIKKYFPYQYVEGNIWLLLSIVDPSRSSKKLVAKVQRKIQNKKINFYLRYGLLMYLAPFVKHARKRILNKYLYENSSILQSLVLPTISSQFSNEHYIAFLKRCLMRTKPDAGLVAAARIAYDDIDMKQVKITKRIKPAVRNCLVGLGLARSHALPIASPFQEIFHMRYNLDILDWRAYLKKEYKHAHRILILAEKAYEMNRSAWLCSMDSFNDIVIRAIISLDRNVSQKLIASSGEKVKYGSLLDSKSAFCRKYKIITDNFRFVHKRRCRVPEIHPYDEKTTARAKPLKCGERNNLYGKLKQAYFDVNEAFKNLPI